jgi:hypothetical protein
MSTNDQWDTLVRKAIDSLSRNRSDGLVYLAELRALLDRRGATRLGRRGTSRANQDSHFKRMAKEHKILFEPEPNPRTLTVADHAAAIRIGGHDNHRVRWNRFR